MKRLNFPTLSLVLITLLTLFTACSTDSETDDIGDNLIGIWQVVDGEAEVFQQGQKIGSIVILTSGTFEFRLDGTGSSDFTMEFSGNKNALVGSFMWNDLGSEILIRDGGESQIWIQVTDQRDLQVLQFTQTDMDNNEITITLTLTK